MKRSLTILVTALFLASVPALAANSNVGVLINLGLPSPTAPVVPIAPAQVKVLPTPGPSLDLGVPYDLVSYDDRYYARQAGRWFTSRHANGPWQQTTWSVLPSQIRHQFETARDQRPVVYGEDSGGSQGNNRTVGE